MEKERRKLKMILEKNETRRLLQILRVLCGPMRFRILMALKYLGQNGLTITNIALILNASPSRISHQMKILKAYKLVAVKKRNREVWYVLADHRAAKYLSGIGI